MALAREALAMARSLLNDDLATKWTDAILLPKLQFAHREMQVNLQLNSIPVIKEATSIITVLAGDTDLGVNQPADLIEPIQVKERDPGGLMDDFAPMTEVNFLPQVIVDTFLIYWSWQGERIKFVGASQNREVLVRYTKGLTIPQSVNDPIGFIHGELFLAPRIAGLANGDAALEMLADRNFDKIIRMNVKGKQGVAHRRLPYRYAGRRRLG